MTDLLLIVLTLWGLSGSLLYLYQRRLARRGQDGRRTGEQDTLYELGVGLISEHGVQALFQKLVDRSVMLLEAEGGAAFQCDAERRWAECVAFTKKGETYREARVDFGHGPVGRAAEDGAIHSQIGRVEVAEASPGEMALLVVPLKWQNEVKGVVLVMRRANQPFTEDDKNLLGLLATQASVALENARLIEVERKRSEELEALREASLRMTSNLQLNAVLEAILEHALKLISAWDAHIFLYDGERLQFAAALWAGDVQRSPFSEPRPEGLTYTVARTGKRLVVEDALEAPIFEDAAWDGAIVGIPLRSKNRVLGVMNVAYEAPHRFSGEELRILDLLADQAAVVLENARLFERTAADRRRLRLLYDITRELAVSTDPDQILRRALDLTKENLGGLLGSIVLLGPDSKHLRVGNLAGYEGHDLEGLEAKLDMRVGKGFVGWIASERQPALATDVLEDPRWSPVPGVDDEVRSALGAPILVDGELLGVLVIFHREPGVFEDEHLDLMVAICRQVGLAWTNAQRFRQIERRLAEQTVIQHAAQVINRRMEMGPLLEEIVEQVSTTLGYDYVGVSLVEDDSLVLMASRGHDASAFRLEFSQGITGRVARTNLPALVGDVDRDPDFVRYFPGTRSELAVPIRKGDVAIGVLNVESPELDGLTQDDLRLLSLLADQMAVAIENAALYERLRRHSAELESTVASRTSELANALDRATEADRLKTQFVSDVSHELRTPLSNIRLYIELLGQASQDRQPAYIETLNRETERLVTLIEDLLSISRLDAGTSPPELVRMDLNEMSRALVADRSKLFSERGLSLQLRLEASSAEVMADENLIAQVIGNLLTNAMHYTPSGGTVTLRTEYSESGDWITLSVSDTGVGILPEEKAHLFDRFFRGSASREMKNPGTGLGLAISHEIVDRHQGRIDVESTLGEGSTFKVRLPAADRIQAAPPATPGRALS
ncbi:MAG: GAF domain-containing protein [Anaerolineales bacterium]